VENQLLQTRKSQIRALIEAGRNAEAIAAAEAALTESIHAGASRRAIATLLDEKARAHRNLGDVTAALDCYLEALISADNENDELDVAWQLALMGKLFGKYLNRPAFFYACLQEAIRRFEAYIAKNGLDSDPRQTRHYAITMDLQGSYYRRLGERDPKVIAQSIRSYERARDLHAVTKSLDGMARASCHLGYALAAQAIQLSPDDPERPQQLRIALTEFDLGFHRTAAVSHAVRGRATRYAQRAHIFFELEANAAAMQMLGRSIRYARESADSRALVLANRIKATIARREGRLREATAALIDGHHAAARAKLYGLQRMINNDLIEVHFLRNQRIEAIQLVEENDELVRSELQAFDFAQEQAFSVYRRVVGENADGYLLKGFRYETASLIDDVLATGKAARHSIFQFERSRSTEMHQSAQDFGFARATHQMKHHLSRIVTRLSAAATEAVTASPEQIQRSIIAIQREVENINVVKTALDESPGESALFLHELRKLATQRLDPRRVVIECRKDILFLNVAPKLLAEAIEHLIENIEQAIKDALPPDDTPLLLVKQMLSKDGGMHMYLLNPGTNPPEPVAPLDLTRRVIAVHGLENARRLFNQLGVDCRLNTRRNGPRTPPFRSNCITLRFPSPTDAQMHRITSYEPNSD
jgi:tetratricopeptide (TPR) repeat protein